MYTVVMQVKQGDEVVENERDYPEWEQVNHHIELNKGFGNVLGFTVVDEQENTLELDGQGNTLIAYHPLRIS